MTGMTVRRAWVIAVAGLVLSFGVPASAQEEGVELLAGFGLGFPGDLRDRGSSPSATGAVTWWWSDHWGVAGWYTAVTDPLRHLPQPERRLVVKHILRPTIRWRTPMFDGRMALQVGFNPGLAWTDMYSEHVRLFPDLLVDVFVGVPVSPSLGLQAGGLWFGRAFLPQVGVAWTF